MKMLIAAMFIIALATSSMAQTQIPATTNLINSSGQKVGTATTWAGVTVYRDINGTVLGSATAKNGIATFKDPDGKITHTIETLNGVITLRNADGEIISTTTKNKDGSVTRK